MLGSALILGSLAATGAGCVLPLPYEAGTDAAPPNYPPIILSSVPDMPGPHTLNEALQATPFSLVVEDQDLGDTICVRVYRDYDEAEALPNLIETCAGNDPVTGSAERIISPLPTNTWCNQAEKNVAHYFDVVVADRPFVPPPAKPEYKAVTEPGEWTSRTWVFFCPEEST